MYSSVSCCTSKENSLKCDESNTSQDDAGSWNPWHQAMSTGRTEESQAFILQFLILGEEVVDIQWF